MMNVTKLTFVSLVGLQLLTGGVAQAGTHQKIKEVFLTKMKEARNDPYYQIKSHSVRELTDEEALEFTHTSDELTLMNKEMDGPSIPNIPPIPPEAGNDLAANPATDTPPPSTAASIDGVIMIIDKLIAIGQKIIPAVKDGRPVVTNNSMASISVLPRSDARDPVVHDMGGWSIPNRKHYKITYKNGLGMEVVSFVYSITYQYNGNVDGKGKYLTGVRAAAQNIKVSYGFNLDASSQLIQISNIGTSSNVIAGATIEMTYTVKNWTRQVTTAESYFISGDGKLYKMD